MNKDIKTIWNDSNNIIIKRPMYMTTGHRPLYRYPNAVNNFKHFIIITKYIALNHIYPP